MDRNDLQGLAEEKIADAILLLSNGRNSNAFYLAGYAIELGLKACISQQFKTDVIPDKKFVTKIYSHDLPELVRLAGLGDALSAERVANRNFDAFWGVANDWTEAARYRSVEKDEAEALITAVNDADHGVLRWIRQHW